ncbi:MAG: hypothetical protein ACKN9T_13100 [Candidatus Methylumidiphilus sp.]
MIQKLQDINAPSATAGARAKAGVGFLVSIFGSEVAIIAPDIETLELAFERLMPASQTLDVGKCSQVIMTQRIE